MCTHKQRGKFQLFKITAKVSIKIKIKNILIFPVIFFPTSVYQEPAILKGFIIFSITPMVQIYIFLSTTMVYVYKQNKEYIISINIKLNLFRSFFS